jgi:Malectin domain
MGRTWRADEFFTGGNAYASNVLLPISGTIEDSLYNSHRYGAAVYSIAVPPGTYTIIFHFAEI